MVERTDGSGTYRVPLPIWQSISWTANGHQLLAYEEATANTSLIYSIDAGVRHSKRVILQRTGDAVADRILESPTGSGYVYATEGGGVWFVPTGGRPELLSKQPDRGAGVLAFSPDGTTIAYGRLDAQVALIRVDRSRARILDVHLGGVDEATWSPDGQTLALRGLDAKQRDVIVLATTTAAPRRIQAKGVDDIAWSPDGTWLAYTDAGGLWLLNPTTLARRHLTDAAGAVAWQQLSASTKAMQTRPRSRIPPADVSEGLTLSTNGRVDGLSMDGSTVTAHVASSSLYCDRMVRWRPGGAVSALPFTGQLGFVDCGKFLGVLRFVSTPHGVLAATADGGLEINHQVALAEAGHDRQRTIANYAATIGGFGTSVRSLRASAGLLAFSTSYVCAGPEIDNATDFRCPRGVLEGSVQRSNLFVVSGNRAHAIRRVPSLMILADAAPDRLLLAEAPDGRPTTPFPQSAVVVDPHGGILSRFPLPFSIRDLRFAGREIVARQSRGLEVLTQAGKLLARYPLPRGSRFIGAIPGLIAIRTATSLELMRLRDGRTLTLLRSAHFSAAFSTAGIAYSHRLTNGLRSGRVVFVPLMIIRARLMAATTGSVSERRRR